MVIDTERIENYLKRSLPGKRFNVQYEPETLSYTIHFDAYLEDDDLDELKNNMRQIFTGALIKFERMVF